MKKTKLIMLPLLALGLIACEGTNTSSNIGTSSSTPVAQSSTTNPEKTSSSKPSSTKVSSSGKDGESSYSSSSSVEEIDYSKGWDKDVLSLMKRYLGGNYVPYYKICGNIKDQYADWEVDYDNYGYLKISGDVSWDTTKTYNELVSLFTNAGWTVDSDLCTATKVVATDSTKKVQATYELDSDSECMKLTATYDEDYDVSSSTSWNSDITGDMTVAFGEVAPFIYLGTKNPNCIVDSYATSPTVTITGGKWNDNVLTDAITAFRKYGYSYTLDSDTNTLVATGKASNGVDTFKMTLTKTTYGVEKPTLEIVYKEGFNPSGFTAWNKTVQDLIDANLDGHSIPVTYLGTMNPTANYSDYRGLYITGQTWDDSILTTAQTTWEADGWTLQSDDSDDWENPSLTFKKEFTTDGCSITAKIWKNYNENPEIILNLTRGMIIPSTATNWSEETQNLMTENLKRVLPYVYLNTTTEKATWDADSSKMTIVGGPWVNKIGEVAIEKFNADTEKDGTKRWTITKSTSDYYIIKGTIDGDTFNIILKKESYTKIAQMQITYIPKYTVPETATGWDEDTTNAFNNYLDEHTSIPYVYLRTTTPSLEDSYNGYVRLSGGYWDDEMLNNANTNFTAANWENCKIKTGTNPGFSAEKDFGDGCKISVSLYKDYSGIANFTVTLKNYYNTDKETQPTGYTTDNETEIAKLGVDVPYIYLGTKTPSASYDTVYSSYNSAKNYLRIDGGSWDDQILTDANTAFTAKNWTTIETKNEYGKSLLAYKTVTETSTDETTSTTTNASYTYVAYVQKDEDDIPSITIYKNKDVTFATTGTYTDSIKNGFQSFVNNTNYMLPYIDFGTNVKGENETSMYNIIGSGIISQQETISYYQALAKDIQTVDGTEYAWDLTLSIEDDNFKIVGTKQMSDGSKIKIDLENRSELNDDTWEYEDKSMLQVYYTPAFKAPEGVTNWDDSIKEAMEDNLDGYVAPYFYMGSIDSDSGVYTNDDESYKYVALTSNAWDDQIYDNMIAALDKDTGWTYMYDYASNEFSTYLTATKTLTTGNHVTLQLFNEDGNAKLYIYYR
jgi:hypothetical protein